MGVPVITLRAPPEGAIHAQNVGASLLSCVGLSDLAADTADDYVTAARRLAADTSRLASLRETLRKDFLASPLADTNAYQRKAEDMFQVITMQVGVALDHAARDAPDPAGSPAGS